MRLAGTLLTTLPVFAATLFIPGRASADVGRNASSALAKGTIGGALLGAELVLAIEAAAGVKSPWAYLGGGLLGAAAGGVGGYFVEQNASPRVSMLMLAGGLTLAIPTTVLVLSATAYEPPADYLLDQPPADEPVADPPQPAAAPGSTPAPTAPATAPSPTSRAPRLDKAKRRAHAERLRLTPPALLDLEPGRLALSIPAVEVRDTYTRAEMSMYGLKQATEFHVPFLNVLF